MLASYSPTRLYCLQRRMQAVRGLKPLLHRSSTAALPASSEASAFATRTSDPTAFPSSESTPSHGISGSSSSSNRRKGWLASLAVAGMTAYVAVSNLEKAPVTGRSQLIFDTYKSPSGQGAAMPKVSNSFRVASTCKDPSEALILRQQGSELLEAAYIRIAEAVSGLAAADPSLQRHLASILNKIELRTYGFDLRRNMGTSTLDKDGHFLYHLPWAPLEKGVATMLSAPAGAMLQQQSADEVITPVAKELAHVIANHKAEMKSCVTLTSVVIGAMAVAFSMGGVSIWASLGVAAYVHTITLWWGMDVWLHRQQVHEADAIAAAISTAAGVSPDTVLTSMQRACCADASTPFKATLQHMRKQRIQWHLAQLQSLLPQSQIPQDPVNDSMGPQLVIDVAAKEISSASAEVKAEYNKGIAILEDCLGEELCYLRNPYKAWTDMHPHWLDCIARIEKILSNESLSDAEASGVRGLRQDANCSAEYPHRNLEQLMTIYQKSPLWAKMDCYSTPYVPVMKAFEDKDAVLSSLQAVRDMSPQSLAQRVKSDATRRFSWPIYWKALKKAYALPTSYDASELQVPSFT